MMKKLLLALSVFSLLAAAPDAAAQSRSKKSKKRRPVTVEQQAPGRAPAATQEQAPVKPAKSESVKGEATPRDNSQSDYMVTTTKEADKPVTPRQVETFAEQQSQPVVQFTPHGEVNWTTQYVTARGTSVIDNDRFKNAAQARAMANRGAIVEAQRNLLEIIKGVNVVGETKVKDMLTESDYIYTRVDGVIKGAEQVGEPVEKNGTIEVTMRVPLYQTNGLANVFYNGQTNTATSSRYGTTTQEAGTAPEGSAAAATQPAAMALNLNGKKFDPALFPVLVDENSNVLFDFSKVYDPQKGQFPQLVKTTRKAFEQAGFGKGVEVIDVISTAPGRLTVDNQTKARISSWGKLGKTMLDIGKLLLLIL